jgi:hypothetical protein
MAVIERLAASWEDALFAVVAILAWLSACLASCPQVTVTSVSKAGIEITAAVPLPGPIVDSIEDNDRELQEDEHELCAVPGVGLISPPPRTLSQVAPPQSVSLSLVAPAQHPLRC